MPWNGGGFERGNTSNGGKTYIYAIRKNKNRYCPKLSTHTHTHRLAILVNAATLPKIVSFLMGPQACPQHASHKVSSENS